MIELRNDELIFRFPEVHADAICTIGFQRTLRIPDDNRDYPLPPGLGTFPLNHVDDYTDKAPEAWDAHGGIFFPMYQAEAMWINFDGEYPMSVKVAAGKIDALTGENWNNELSKRPQDYLVVPEQPWLDGFCVGEGLIRQFVAMPLGEGYSAEEQLTGEAQHGGLQIVVYPMKASRYSAWLEEQVPSEHVMYSPVSAPLEMGLAPGGLMRQEIYEDPYGLDSVGYFGALALLRAYRKQRSVPSVVWNKAAANTAYGAGVHSLRPAVVRVLRWRPAGTGRREETGWLGQCCRKEI